MPEINIPKGLAEELGEERNSQINSLVNFEEMLKVKLEKDTLSDEMRASIEKKMQALVDVLDNIRITAKARHMSVDTKKENIGRNIDSFDFKGTNNLLKEVNGEIDSTEKTLQSKIKSIAMDIKKEAEETAERMTKAIHGNIKLVKEGLSLSKKEQRRLADRIDGDSLFDIPSENEETQVEKKDEAKNDLAEKLEELKGKKKDKNKGIKRLNKQYDKIEEQMETAMVKYKSEGFIGTFKKLWVNRKENHQGFFSILNEALWEAYDNKEERAELKEDRNILYEKQCEIDKRIKKAERELKELSKQIKDVRRELGISGEKALEKAKATYTNVVSSSPEVTPENILVAREKITLFGEKRLERIKANIERAEESIDTLEGEILDARAAKSSKRFLYEQAKEKDSSVIAQDYIEEKIGNKLIRGVSKMQYMVANHRLKKKNRKFEKANKYIESQRKRLERYEGIIDR